MYTFIGCSSKEVHETYHDLAQRVGRLLQHEPIIIGGTFEGLMGVVAKNHPNVIQIILEDYLPQESVSNRQIVCHSSFERLQQIWNHADQFLFLPGGTGSLTELLAFLEENRTNEPKRIILFNDRGYYDDILAFFEKCQKEKFASSEVFSHLVAVSCYEELSALFSKNS